MINVMYAGNKGVFDGMLISALSMCRHTKETIHIYILTMDLTDENPLYQPIGIKNAEYIQKILRESNESSTVHLIDMTDLFKECLSGSPNLENMYTPYAMLRLLSHRVLEIPDKILYLDTDTVILGDISELYGLDIDNYEYAASRDYFGKFFFGLNYINSGVLLLNMKKIRENGLFENATLLCRERKIFLSDQSSINMCTDSRLLLPSRFNEQKRCREDTLIRHFSMTIKWFPYFHTRNVKPWNITAVKKYLYKYDYVRIKDILSDYAIRKQIFEYPEGKII